MNNYIANERGGWATSSGYMKYSFARSIHFGRVFTSGARGTRGREADLCEALRCLGQGLHCLEDFGAHTNYVELSLRELGYHNVFPHTGTASEIFLINGTQAFPLVTGVRLLIKSLRYLWLIFCDRHSAVSISYTASSVKPR